MSTCATGKHAGRPTGEAFSAWRGEPLPESRFVDLAALAEPVRLEMLVGLQASIERHRRTPIADQRRVVAIFHAERIASIVELDPMRLRTQTVRLFIAFAQECIRLALADPDIVVSSVTGPPGAGLGRPTRTRTGAKIRRPARAGATRADNTKGASTQPPTGR